jgi:hypothetical protein
MEVVLPSSSEKVSTLPLAQPTATKPTTLAADAIQMRYFDVMMVSEALRLSSVARARGE